MRLFTGISLPESVLYTIDRFLAPLRPLASIRWSPLTNLHITTKFIGDWPSDRLPELTAALLEITSPQFTVCLKDLGWFPDARGPHVFWMGMEENDSLHKLARATECACLSVGCPREEREYHPHLTLARIGRGVNLQPLRRMLDDRPPPALPAFHVNEFHLYQSDSGSYRKLQTYDLGEPRKID